MTVRDKLCDRTNDGFAGDWSIGCSDEFEGDGLRVAWDADAGFDVRPVRTARRHLRTDGAPTRAVRPTRYRVLPAATADGDLTVTQRAVRDYRRAWRSIHAKRKPEADAA